MLLLVSDERFSACAFKKINSTSTIISTTVQQVKINENKPITWLKLLAGLLTTTVNGCASVNNKWL